jgi:hypothetical protein
LWRVASTGVQIAIPVLRGHRDEPIQADGATKVRWVFRRFGGGKVETGFAFGKIETVVDAWVGIWPAAQPSGFLCLSGRLSIAL